MQLLQVFAAALVAATFPMLSQADWLEDQSNSTIAYKRVEKSDLTAAELDALNIAEKRWLAKLSRRGGLNRRDCDPRSYKATKKVGTGNPHQNYRYQQITGDITCDGGGSGSISKETDTSVSWSIGLDGNGGDDFPFIDGGFSVGKTYGQSQTESYTCSAHDTTVCIWQKVAYTAFTVQPQVCYYGCSGLECTASGGPKVLYAPNSNQFGGCFYKGTNNRFDCENAIGSCPGLHNGFFKACGAAGGPPGQIVCNKFDAESCTSSCQP